MLTDHDSLRYFMSKKDAKLRLIRWVLMLYEFDFKVKYRKGITNHIADHLSCLEKETMIKLGDELEIDGSFPDKQLLAESQDLIPWFEEFSNYLESDIILDYMLHQ